MTAQDNEQSPVIEAQTVELQQQGEEPFEVPSEELDALIEDIKAPKKKRSKGGNGKVRFTANFPDGKSSSTVSAFAYTHAVITPHEDSFRVAEWALDQTSAHKWADSRDKMETIVVPVYSKYSQLTA